MATTRVRPVQGPTPRLHLRRSVFNTLSHARKKTHSLQTYRMKPLPRNGEHGQTTRQAVSRRPASPAPRVAERRTDVRDPNEVSVTSSPQQTVVGQTESIETTAHRRSVAGGQALKGTARAKGRPGRKIP